MKPLQAKYLDVVYASVPVRESADRRPCIVVRLIGPSEVVLAPCASQWDLFVDGRDFSFPPDHKDYAAMGFRRPSYAIGLPFVRTSRKRIIRIIGHLRGELAIRFVAWARDEAQ